MRINLGHPAYPQYAFNIHDVTKEAARRIDRLAPVRLVSRAFDWPETFGGFRGWTDTFNSLWWPQEADQFATCVLVINDAQNDLLNACVTAQKDTTLLGSWVWPWLELSFRLAPADGSMPGETFPALGITEPVEELTEILAFKLYPLTPINVSSLDSSYAVRGLWLLPLVDVRYFMRTVPLNNIGTGSSASGAGAQYPLISVTRDDTPNWMPPLRSHPQDIAAPLYYATIPNQGTERSISADTRLGAAADKQAAMQSWRVVCRDVRSNYSGASEADSHTSFTGVVSDYPEQWSLPDEEDVTGYHIDAISLFEQARSRLSGGLSDVRMIDDLMPRKIQFLFDILDDTEASYSVTIRCTTNYPSTVSDFAEDTDGPNTTEKSFLPAVHLGPQVSSRSPGLAEHLSLVAAAKQWYLIFTYWRRKQAYFKYPGIYPVIPNGHAKMIRWDFRRVVCETTYIAVEGVMGFTSPRPGGSVATPCVKIVLTGVDYTSGVYEGYRVTEEVGEGGLSYTIGERLELPIYHLGDLDLVVWTDSDSSTASGPTGPVPVECVVSACRGAGNFYTINDQPQVDIVKKNTPEETITIDDVTYKVSKKQRYNQYSKELEDVKTALVLDVTDIG